MNGWSSVAGSGDWDDEPAWVYEITWEWEPLPGQRYPGDPGRRRVVHTPVYEASGASEPDVDVGPPGSRPGYDLAARGYEQGRSPADEPARPGGPSPQPRAEPSWNQPVPLPERLTGSRAARRAAPLAPEATQSLPGLRTVRPEGH